MRPSERPTSAPPAPAAQLEVSSELGAPVVRLTPLREPIFTLASETLPGGAPHTLPCATPLLGAPSSPAPRPSLGDLMSHPPVVSSQSLSDPPAAWSGEERYAEQAELGRGGLGRVMLALDRRVGRHVAIKELLPRDAVSADDVRVATERFLREARVTGQLEHPNIVPVYELGQRPDGTVYYTMRVVHGRTLAEALRHAKTQRERLALLPHFADLCQAIAFAHSRGVVHRDIKPDNVMLGEFGETVVLDWGIAKLVSPETPAEMPPPQADPGGGDATPGRESAAGVAATEASPPHASQAEGARPSQRYSAPTSSQRPTTAGTAFDPLALGELRAARLSAQSRTQQGTLCGTPTFMSPEQALGRLDRVDERSDIWSLGTVLFMLLAGRPPFQGDNLLALLSQVISAPLPNLFELEPHTPPELAAIVDRALQREPEARYPNARALARDIVAFQSGARVAVHEYSSRELVTRFVQRHRSAVVVGLMGLFVALTLGAVSYQRVRKARDRAVVAEKQAIDGAERANRMLSEALVEKAQIAFRHGDGVSAELLAARALELVETPDARGILMATRNLPLPVPRPSRRLDCDSIGHTSHGRASDGSGAVLCVKGETLRWVHPDTPHSSRLLATHLGAYTLRTASASGARIVAADTAGTLRVMDASEAPDSARTVDSGLSRLSALAVDPTGQRLALGTAVGEVAVLELGTFDVIDRLSLGESVSRLSWSRDAQWLAMGGERGALLVSQLETHQRVSLAGHTGTLLALDFAPQSGLLASGAADRTLRLWRYSEGQAVGDPWLAEGQVQALAWSPRGEHLLLGTGSGKLHWLDPRLPERSVTLHHQQQDITWVRATRAGNLETFSPDGLLRSWELPAAVASPRLLARGNQLVATFTSEGLASGGLREDGICLWDVAREQCRTRLPVLPATVRALATDPAGTHLALGGRGGQVHLWDLQTLTPTRVLRGDATEVRALAYSADGSLLVTAGVEGVARIWDAATGQEVGRTPEGSAIQSVDVAPHGERVLLASRDGWLREWDLPAGHLVRGVAAHDDWAMVGRYAPGDHWLSAGAGGELRLFDAQGQRLATRDAHRGRVLALAVAPGAGVVASAGEDGQVRIWRVADLALLATLDAHEAAVRTLAWSSDGRTLASGSDDGTLRLWAAAALESDPAAIRRATERQHRLRLTGSRVVVERR